MSLVCNRYCARLACSTQDTTRGTSVVLISYTTALMLSSTALTIYGYAAHQSLLYYVLALVFIYGFLYINPLVAIINNVLYTVTLCVAITVLGKGEPAAYAMLILCGAIAAIVSLTNYHSRTRVSMASEAVFETARHDALTGIKNRRAVDEDIVQAIGRTVYLLIGDIDDFKFYNDSFGHDKGDELLCSLAQTMCQAFGNDNVYRSGGDEFLAIAFDVDQDDFLAKVKSWRDAFGSVDMDGSHYTPTASGGYVHGTPQDAEELREMLRLADMRLYDAKQAGRNRVLGIAYEGKGSSDLLGDSERLLAQRSGSVDPLTGLPSLTYFTLHARTLLNSPGLEETPFYLVYFNVENMKAYNERHGMAQGDDLLSFVAKTLKGSFEPALVTRMGDDRFALITYGADPRTAIEQVYEQVRSYRGDLGAILRAGVYEYERGTDLNIACDFAKLACDHIKGHRNTHYYVYDAELHVMHERKQEVLDRFERALQLDQIQVYYQPIVRSLSGRVCECEALTRWIDADSRIIPPGDFIPVLEEYRLVHLLDLRVIENVCRDIRRATDEGLRPLPVNVNLSRYDMELCDVVAETQKALARHQVAPSMLNIEITESAFSENTGLLKEAIDRFHELGMQVWIDDFGSGYSSLNVVREFDFDVVKFDMLFMRSSSERSTERSRAMIPHLIDMAKDLGMQTLVEGVETQAQYEFLRRVGCEKLQGFAFYRPMPLEDCLELLGDTRTHAEIPDERDYYDPIGQVNIATPVAIDPDIAHSVELSGGMPAAIVEFRDGRVSYLHWNSSYLDYLQDIGMDSIENSTQQMNDHTRTQSQGFFRAAAYLRDKQEWLNLSFREGKDLCTGMARRVAADEASGAVAFVYIAFNVTRYLARAGLTVSEDAA